MVGTSPAEALDERRRHPDQALRLVLVEAGRPDDLLDIGRVGAGEVLRCRVLGEQDRRDHVHPDVGGLGGQDRRGEQFEGIGVVELALRVRIGLGQPAGDLAAPDLSASAAGWGGDAATGESGDHDRVEPRRTA